MPQVENITFVNFNTQKYIRNNSKSNLDRLCIKSSLFKNAMISRGQEHKNPQTLHPVDLFKKKVNFILLVNSELN